MVSPMPCSLRVAFAGTPKFAATYLDALIHSKHQVIVVFTQPDRPTGRYQQIKPSPVKQLAKIHNLPILQPSSCSKFEEMIRTRSLQMDVVVVVAYGLILPKMVLNFPRFGCINVHASLLPRWRGAAPIQRAILAGDKITGITIIKMDAGIDTGCILHETSCAITAIDTSASLTEKLALIGVTPLLTVLNKLASTCVETRQQNNALASYARKILKKEARINWQLPAVQLERCIRAFNPWPVSYFKLNNRIFKVWGAKVTNSVQKEIMLLPGTVISTEKCGIHVCTGDGVLTLTLIQVEGKKITPVREFLNARHKWFIPGSKLD